MTIETRIKFQDIIEDQLPRFIREDFPLLPDFLKSFYVSQEIPGGPYDLIQNLDRYVKVDELYDIKTEAILSEDLDMQSDTVLAQAKGNFTVGFPENNGLIQIDDEIILYGYKTDAAFKDCVRGFSGITSYIGSNTPDKLVFSESVATTHTDGTIIKNLNVIFLQEFFKKVKTQFAPGFTERPFASEINQRNFIFNNESFYGAKGTDNAFEILFKALYSANVEVIHPDRFLFRPSNGDYKVTKDFIVEKISGDPTKLVNLTLTQKSTGARGTITRVVPILYDKGQFYEVSIDAGFDRDISVKGTIDKEFIPNPKTKITNTVSIGQSIIDVDSTIGFPESGTVIVLDPDDLPVGLAYTGKSINQLYHVTGINNTFVAGKDLRVDDYSYAYVGINTTEQIQVRIGSSLQEIEFKEENYSYEKGDTINLQSLGVESRIEKASNFIYNIKTNWQVREILIIDEEQKKYTFNTWDDQYLKPGHKIELKSRDPIPVVVTGEVTQVTSDRSFEVILSDNISLIRQWDFENQILKGNSSKYPYLDNYIANIQNSYVKPASGDVLVASNSIPFYENKEINPYNKKIVYTGRLVSTETIPLTTTTDHGFYTGDAIYYKAGVTNQISTTPDGLTFNTPIESRFNNIDDGVYYVRRMSETQIKMSRSKGDLYSDIYVEFTGDVTDNEFIYFDFYQKILQPQGIVRQLLPPDPKSGVFKTDPGFTGILNNGVEILNYKSQNSTLYYGDVRSFEVKKGGYNYDVVGPPLINLEDKVGTGATGDFGVTGNFKRIEVINFGFDYTETPVIQINGGNPIEPAEAEANMISLLHELPFNSGEESAGSKGVNLTNDTIGFTTFHKFRDAEQVIYDSRGLENVVGLVTEAPYWVSIVDNFTIKLHNNIDDARAVTNPVDLTGYGSGRQFIRAFELKRVVSNINVTNPGEGYQNKKRTIGSTGITTSTNSIVIKNHGYLDKEIVRYTAPVTGDSVTGLAEDKDYYVLKQNDDEFSVAEVGIGSTAVDYYYDNFVITEITKTGGGSFNYQPITVTAEGTIGVSTRAGGQDFNAVLQPIVRGEITSVDMTQAGVGYGASEILNFNRQPVVTIENGRNCQAKAIINNGQISSILMQNVGKDYWAPPDIEIISATGNYAQLTPIIDPAAGVVNEIIVIKGGAGYVDGETEIIVKAPGLTAQIEANIRSWQVNLFERNLNTIKSDDGFVEDSINHETLEYSHLYAPRPLREATYAISGEEIDNTLYGTPDLVKDSESGVEVSSVNHSPILGYAYDGHPIYGPYAFTNTDGTGAITEMISGYELKPDETNRPPLSLYPAGFFIEDYVYIGNGHLDEHNGRFAITPDYPDGIYAYHATIGLQNDSAGPFEGYRKPSFPYFIGSTFKSKPLPFNLSITATQTEYNIAGNEWLRNTRDYHTNSFRSGYDYIFNSNTVRKQTLEVVDVSLGEVNEIGITTGGTNYKVGDEVEFDNIGTNGRNAAAEVDRVGGKKINTVSLATTSFDNVELVPLRYQNGAYSGILTVPHNLENEDIITVSNLSSTVRGLGGGSAVGVTSEALILSTNMTASTEQVEYAGVYGLKNTSISSNDILLIDQEKVKVLNVDSDNGRIRIRRAQEGTTVGYHTNGANFLEDPRRFNFVVGGINSEQNFRVNRELYFNPPDVVGTGTARGVGIGTTVVFSNPGAGVTQAFIRTQHMRFPDHGLELNDEVVYKANGGTPIQVWTGVSGNPYVNMDVFDNLYAIPLTKDTVGIATGKVGLDSNFTGYYVGINSIAVPSSLYFTNTGVGNTHSFKTRLSNVITGTVSQNVVTVSTATTHQLQKEDTVWVSIKEVGITNIIVKYNDYNRRIVFDPQDFVAGDIDLSLDTITVAEGVFKEGDKVIHTAASPAGGLVNEKMYYILEFAATKIRLVEERTELQSSNPTYVDISSAASGTLSKINPSLLTRKSEVIKFDLSDSSLSFIDDGVSYSAFKLDLYTDQDYKREFYTTQKDDVFEVRKTGNVGVDSDASLSVSLTKDIPKILYYKFSTDNNDRIPDIKKEIIVDTTVVEFNQINTLPTYYDGNWTVSAVGSTSFQYNIPLTPDVTQYNFDNSIPEYYTSSKTAEGSIYRLNVKSGGALYKVAPRITNVSVGSTLRAGIGSGAILSVETSSIGSITKTKLNNIGFDYPTDRTLKVIPNLPDIVQVDRLSTFDYIDVTYQGKNYPAPPDFVAIDGYTKEVLADVDLSWQLGDDRLTIVSNTEGIYNVPPRIVPVGNPNGVGIRDLSYSATGAGTSTNVPHTVRLFFDRTFSNAEDFEKGGFDVGETFLLENVSVGLGSTGRGYNSKEYGYKLWTITASSGQIGGANAFMEFVLPDEEIGYGRTPGKMVPAESAARVTLASHFPRFKSTLKQSMFFEGEKVQDEVGATGEIIRWAPENNTLTISTEQEFDIGSKIKGMSSLVEAYITHNINFKAEVTTGAGATVDHGFQSDSGFLNNSFQRMPDNGYYQRFSYALKSTVPEDTWGDTVKALSHVAGFSRWSDLDIESKDPDAAITRTEPANFELVAEIQSFGDVNLYPDFDDATEIAVDGGGRTISRDVIFQNRAITDYYQSVGNRAFDIDDFSSIFDSNERPTKFSRVGEFTKNDTYNKILTLVKDQTYTDERQFSIVSLLQHNDVGYINEYAILETYPEIGTYDYSSTETGWDLTFVPIKSEYNLYDISNVSISLKDNIAGVASTALGSVVSMGTTNVDIGAGTTTNIAKIPTTYRSSKLLVQLESEQQDFFVSELSLVHDGTKVNMIEYGDLQNNLGESQPAGFGTYNAYISGGNVNVDFIPSIAGVAFTANASTLNLADHATGITTSVVTLDTGRLISNKSATGAAATTAIVTYSSDGSGSNFVPTAGYYFVSVEGTGDTNGMYECFEVAVLNSESNQAVVDFAQVGINTNTLGTVGVTSTSNSVSVTYFGEHASNVKVWGIEMQIYDDIEVAKTMPLENVEVYSNRGRYVGTKLDLQTAFDLKHKTLPIFRRQFNGAIDAGTGGNGVNLTANTVDIPDHFFVTGEKVNYSYSGEGSINAIGIEETVVAGIGTTDKLPQDVYAVKFSSSGLRFAESAEKALKKNPEVFTINSVGIGTSHHVTATNQNSKGLLAIDNMIQSPIAGTAVTTALNGAIVFGQAVAVTGITSFAASDLIKVEDEICRVLDVGVGGNNMTLLRAQLGTGLAAHGDGSIITKLTGNYNIVQNTLHFAEAPKGNTPLSTTTDPDQTDYTGIVTHSTFHGRIFTRTAPTNSTLETYSTNMVFNDISDQFTGIQSYFNLTTGFGTSKTNALGFSTYNGVTLVNDMFQEPSSLEQGNYNFGEKLGITTVTFTGEATEFETDRRPIDQILGENANRSNYPTGGKILSVGSNVGYAYQPLVSAGGTTIISGLGSVTSVSIGNTGSGYRTGTSSTITGKSEWLPIVGVQTYSSGIATYVAIGTATISDGHIISINLDSPPVGVGYTLYVDDSVTTMTAVAAAGTTIISVATTDRINTGSIVSIAQTTLASASTQVGIITNVVVVSVGQSQFTIGAGNTVNESVGIGTTTAAPVVSIKRYEPPEVIIDSPVPYTNIPLEYHSSSTAGVGQSASIDIVVGQGSSVVDFEIKKEGYGFGNGEILTVPIGGKTGIPTDTSKTFSDFKLTIQDIHTDEFSGWHFGQLQPLDNFSSSFDGFKKVFQMKVNDEAVSLRSTPGWDLNPADSLLVFINGLLQKPEYAFTLGQGGSSIIFTTPPNAGDYAHVLFYRGTPEIDVAFLNIAKSIKKGDRIELDNNPEKGQGLGLNQGPRTIIGITSLSSDSVSTNPYWGLGITTDTSLARPASWRKQTEDLIIDVAPVGKDRVELEPDCYPASYMIQNVGSATTIIYVDSVRPFFNPYNEAATNRENIQNFVDLRSQNSTVSGLATAIVSDTGTITDLVISEVGLGYTGAPTVSIQSPPEGSGFTTATATATVSIGGTLTKLTVVNAGTGYTNTAPPVVNIGAPIANIEYNVDVDSYAGDYGSIVGFGTTTISNTNQIIFDFFIPLNSPLREATGASSPVGSAITVSEIAVNDYFTTQYTNKQIPAPLAVNTPTSLTLISAGSGYKTEDGSSTGTRENVGTTGGGGTGMRVNVTISGGEITSIEIDEDGDGPGDRNYIVGATATLNVSPGSGCQFEIDKAYGTLESRKSTDKSVRVGATTSYCDCVYQVASTEVVTVNNTSIGIATVGSATTNVRRVFCNIAGISTDNFDSTYFTFDSNKVGVGTVTFDTDNAPTYSGVISHSPQLGDYSWGKIIVSRDKSNTFEFFGDNGNIGLSTSAMVIRSKPLEMNDYAT